MRGLRPRAGDRLTRLGDVDTGGEPATCRPQGSCLWWSTRCQTFSPVGDKCPTLDATEYIPTRVLGPSINGD